MTETVSFTGDPAADYVIDIDDSGSEGADGSVALNGGVLMTPRTGIDIGPRHLRLAVQLGVANRLEVRLTGKPASSLSVSVLGGAESVGPAGGTIVAPSYGSGGERVIVTVPPGALSSFVELQIAYRSPPPTAASSAVRPITPFVDLLPHGQAFASHVTLRFTGLGLTGDGAAVAQVEADRMRLEESSAWDPGTQELAARLQHFSTWAVISMLPLTGGAYTWRLDIAPSGVPQSTLEEEIARAFAQWEAYLGRLTSPITFTRTTSSTARFEISSSPLEPGVLAEVSWSCSYWPVISCTTRRITLDDDLPYAATSRFATSDGPFLLPLLPVLAHEVGHTLALWHAGLTGSQPPIMAPRAGEYPYALGDDDVVKLVRNYGPSVPAWLPATTLGPQAPVPVPLGASTAVPVGSLPSVVVTDAVGDPVPGVPVVFRPLDGSTASAAVQVTDGSGRATVGGWSVPSGAGTFRIEARIYLSASGPTAVTFTAVRAVTQTRAWRFCEVSTIGACSFVQVATTPELSFGRPATRVDFAARHLQGSDPADASFASALVWADFTVSAPNVPQGFQFRTSLAPTPVGGAPTPASNQTWRVTGVGISGIGQLGFGVGVDAMMVAGCNNPPGGFFRDVLVDGSLLWYSTSLQTCGAGQYYRVSYVVPITFDVTQAQPFSAAWLGQRPANTFIRSLCDPRAPFACVLSVTEVPAVSIP